MNIELLPFSAFVLDACTAVSTARGDAHTLTLELALSAGHPVQEPMSGSATSNEQLSLSAPILSAAILPADAAALTLTF